MSKTPKISISIIIIASNAESSIAQCIKSVSAFDDVVVYINNSSDNSKAIAESFVNTQVHAGSFIGFGPTKQQAVALAKNNWVFNLDADEVLTPKLIDEIRLLTLKEQSVYAITRRNHYAKKYIRGCGWQNDKPVRIFNRLSTNYNNQQVHESVEVGNLTTITLQASFNHYPFESVAELLKKADSYATLYAKQHTGSKPSSLTKACLSSLFIFLKSYVLHYGFIDGRQGFIICSFNAFGGFLKYLKLWEANQKQTYER